METNSKNNSHMEKYNYNAWSNPSLYQIQMQRTHPHQ